MRIQALNSEASLIKTRVFDYGRYILGITNEARVFNVGRQLELLIEAGEVSAALVNSRNARVCN